MTQSIVQSRAVVAVDYSLPARERTAKRWPTIQIVSACVALHLLAAAVAYRHLVRDLYDIFDANPRLLVLEHGLARLTGVVAFLPPVAPAILIIAAALWVGPARRVREVARWLSLAPVPLALDSALRALGLVIAPPASNPGELLDLPMRFSPGPRLVAELVGAHPGAGLSYWMVVCSLGALTSVYCVARALYAGEESALEPVERRRRRRAGDAIGMLQSLVVASAA
ncbi:MAG: hypothetical protein HOQ09_07780, partial [Gemmatimonadaceae bacterium]|nr:hypothetical protein [Gemmatimonadaceae bacterium]